MNTFSGTHRDVPMETPGGNESLGKGRPLPIILALEANLKVLEQGVLLTGDNLHCFTINI
jgi:hypothetical protein